MASFGEILTTSDLSVEQDFQRQLVKQDLDIISNHAMTKASNLPLESLGVRWIKVLHEHFSRVATFLGRCWELMLELRMSDLTLYRTSIFLLGLHHLGQTLLLLIPSFPTQQLDCSFSELLVYYWSLWTIPCAAAISLLIEHQWGRHQVAYYEGAIVASLIVVCYLDCMEEYYDDDIDTEIDW